MFVHLYSFQVEGVDGVFDELERTGVNAVALTTKLARPTDSNEGTRLPPLHLDGHRRVLARPRWGSRQPRVEWFSAYRPDVSLYTGSGYRPLDRAAPAPIDPDLLHRAIAAAHQRGMEAHVQIQPFQPPSLRDDDMPVRVDGSLPSGRRVARTAALTAPDVRTYALALVEDVLKAIPEIDGLFCDWTEFGAYHVDDMFADFGRHTRRWAQLNGYDWESMLAGNHSLFDRLHHLDDDDLRTALRCLTSSNDTFEWLVDRCGMGQTLDLRRQVVTETYAAIRARMDHAGFARVKLSARGWPPPWNRLSGMDYADLAKICDAVTPKLFAFDYSALPGWYARQLLEWNPNLTESLLLDVLVAVMDLPDHVVGRRLTDYRIPAPDEETPASPRVFAPRIAQVAAQAAGNAACLPFGHAYMPIEQWRQLLRVVADSPADGLWVQMFSYLDEPRLVELEAFRRKQLDPLPS